MSEKQRFAVRESVEIWDERSGSLLAHAVSGDRALMIANALNATYGRSAEPRPQESAPSAKQYYIRSFDDRDGSGAKHFVNCKTPDGISFNVAVFDNLGDALKERDRLNAEAKAALTRAEVRLDAAGEGAPAAH